MMKTNKYLKITILLFLSFAIYYQFDYKRHFITSKDNNKSFTIWQRFGNKCYVIPGKYYSPFSPKSNFIETVNYRNYIGVVFNTEDSFDYKISIYNDFKINNLDPKIKVYENSDSLLLEYKMLEKLDIKKGIRVSGKQRSYYSLKHDHVYIDLNDICGISVKK